MGILCPTCGGSTERVYVIEGGVKKPLYVCRSCVIAWRQENGKLGIHLLHTYAMAKDLDDDAFYELLKRISDYESGGAPKLSDIMSTEVAVVFLEESLLEVATLLAETGARCAVVIDAEGCPKGIITRSELAERLSEEQEPEKVKAEDVMSWPVIAAEDYTSILKASEIMRKKGIKYLPVTRKGKIVGMVTVEDFAKAPPEYLEEIAPKLAELGAELG